MGEVELIYQKAGTQGRVRGMPPWPLWLAELTVFLVKLSQATLRVVLASFCLVLVNGTLEEVLWRGVCVKAFPGRMVLGYLYPSLGFALCPLVPRAVPMPGGVATFTVGALFLGLCSGWVVWRTGSIRWTVGSHMLTDLPGLGALGYLGG